MGSCLCVVFVQMISFCDLVSCDHDDVTQAVFKSAPPLPKYYPTSVSPSTQAFTIVYCILLNLYPKTLSRSSLILS
jgi:hypothetical protein